MTRVIAMIVIAMMFSAGCAAHKAARRAHSTCASRLPVIDSTAHEYRIIKSLRGGNDNDLAYQACALGADAVLRRNGPSTIEIRTGLIGLAHRDDVYGAAIKYVRIFEPSEPRD